MTNIWTCNQLWVWHWISCPVTEGHCDHSFVNTNTKKRFFLWLHFHKAHCLQIIAYINRQIRFPSRTYHFSGIISYQKFMNHYKRKWNTNPQSQFLRRLPWHVGRCCVGLLTFLSDHCPSSQLANSNITLAWGAGPLWSHRLHICCFNNNKHRKKFVIIDQFDESGSAWRPSSTGSGISGIGLE